MVTSSDSMTALQATSYFEKDNYYIKDGITEKGQWFGQTAETLGVQGDINMKDFYAIASGIDPKSFTDSQFIELKKLDKLAVSLTNKYDSIMKMPEKQQSNELEKYNKSLEKHNEARENFNEELGKAKLIRDTKMSNNGILLHARAGFDLTFSAPKSVSTMALIAGDIRLIDAHKESVNTVMKYLEEHFAQTREYDADGKRKHFTVSNLIASQFTHYTSRAADDQTPDPQLHTHNFIFNMVKTTSGFKSFSNEEILKAVKLAGQIYQTEYANKVEKLGYATEWNKTGTNYTFEIKGVSKEMLDFFSKRHNQIETAVNDKEVELGRSMTKAERIIAKRELVLTTRSGKEPQDISKLTQSWNAQLKDKFELPADSLKELTSGLISDRAINSNLKDAIKNSVTNIENSKAVYSQHDLIQELAKTTQGSASIEQLREAVQQNTHGKERLQEETDMYKLGSSKQNDKTILYSSLNMMGAEGNIFTKLKNGKNFGAIIDDKNKFEKLKNATAQHLKIEAEGKGEQFYDLTSGQNAGLEHILTNKEQLIGIQGDAGVGKTTMLKHLNVAVGENVELIGLAPTAKAASEITNASGIQSHTIDSFLAKDEKNISAEKKRIIIIDESSMVGTKKLDNLLKKVLNTNTKVVLIGDMKQLKAVEAGDIFTKLIEHGMQIVEMTESIRHKTDLTKEVTKSFKDVATVSVGLDRLQADGRLKDGSKEAPENAKKYVEDTFAKNAVSDYIEHGLNSTIALVNTNAERKYFNEILRSKLQNKGKIDKNNISFEILESKRLNGTDLSFAGNYNAGDILISNKMQGDITTGRHTEILNIDKQNNMIEIKYFTKNGEKTKWLMADKLDKFSAYEKVNRDFSIGDKISFEKNEKKNFGFSNGETAVVKNIDDKGNITVDYNKRSVTFNISEYSHISHAYVMTTHKSQGQSIDNVHIFADSSQGLNSFNAGYVQMTRAIKNLFLYTDNREKLEMRYKTIQNPENVVDHMDRKEIESFAEVNKIRDAANQISLAVSNQYKDKKISNKKIKTTIVGGIRRTREVKLYEMDKRLVEYGKVDLNGAYKHAIEHGYAHNAYIKSLENMKKRLDQLEKKGYVRKTEANVYIFNQTKEAEFHEYKESLLSASDRHLIASKTFSENFKLTFKKINTKKAFVGRKYGHGTGAEVNAGVDKILNEAFAGTIALVVATSKFASKRIFNMSIKQADIAIKFIKSAFNSHEKKVFNSSSKFNEKLQMKLQPQNKKSLENIKKNTEVVHERG